MLVRAKNPHHYLFPLRIYQVLMMYCHKEMKSKRKNIVIWFLKEVLQTYWKDLVWKELILEQHCEKRLTRMLKRLKESLIFRERCSWLQVSHQLSIHNTLTTWDSSITKSKSWLQLATEDSSIGLRFSEVWCLRFSFHHLSTYLIEKK